MRQKSFFAQLLKNFMLTLFVPIAAVLLIYFYAEHSIQTQITESSQKSLNQFFSAIDTTVEDMRDTCMAMLNNDQCELYVSYMMLKPEKAAYQVKVVYDALKNASQPRYADVFVYFPDDERIISGVNPSTEAVHYFNSFYNGVVPIDRTTEEWKAFASILSYPSYAPGFGILSQNGSRNLCVMASRSRYTNDSLNMVSVVSLDESYMNSLIGSELLDPDIHFLIFDSSKQLLMSSNSQLQSLSIAGYPLDENGLEMEIDGKPYLLMVRQSANLKGYYATAIPMDYYANRLRTLHITCWLSIFATIVLSILVAWRNSVRSWNPFEALYVKLQTQNKHADLHRAGNELEFIELLFQKEQDEKMSLIGKVGASILLQKEKAISTLLLGSVKDEEEILHLIEQNELHFPHRCFYVCLLRLESSTSAAPDAFACEHALRGVFKNISPQTCEWYVTHTGEMEFCLLVNCTVDMEETLLIQALTTRYHLFEQALNADVTTGISLRKDAISQLPRAFDEARIAMTYSFFASAGEFIRYSEICDREFTYAPFLEHNLSGLVIDYIASRSDQPPQDFVSSIFSMYGINRTVSIEIVDCFRYEVLNALYKTMVSYQYSHSQRYDRLGCILTAKHLQEFEMHIVQILSELQQKYLKSSGQTDVCSQAREYIRQHFAQPQLSLEEIAGRVGCSSSYLSRAFRQKYGVTLLNYIADVRTAVARTLLETTDLSIADVAVRTGYLSSNTFVKNFKKIEGITPTVYRSLKRQKNGE